MAVLGKLSKLSMFSMLYDALDKYGDVPRTRTKSHYISQTTTTSLFQG